MIRFARKYYVAEALSARMFSDEKHREEVLLRIQSTALYKREEHLSDLLQLSCSKLQQWVRASWLCDPGHSKPLQSFVATVVKPALACAAHTLPEHMQFVMSRFLAVVSGNAADEQDAITMKLAASVLSGELQSHPLIQGLMLACHRTVKRQQEGKSLRGRHQACTDRELALISDAGLTLALHACNTSLALEFGLPASYCRISTQALDKNSLPQFALALQWPSLMEQNWELVQQRYVKHPKAPNRFSAQNGSNNFKHIYIWIVLDSG